MLARDAHVRKYLFYAPPTAQAAAGWADNLTLFTARARAPFAHAANRKAQASLICIQALHVWKSHLVLFFD